LSYLVLARKARPATFDEVVGQQAVVRTLKNALERGRVPHGLIFSGIRGTGKTTLARIMAKALNCEQGPTATPCGRCRPCQEIAAGSAVDLHEIDGASNRGIQEIRDLKENIRFMPTSARFKIIIIDEVHMLTTEAFNALLKTLEEPPDHVYFMFATTELHKVPVTILSRCQRYELKRVGHRELGEHLARLAGLEGVEVDEDAIRLVVRESGGSVRDGLSLLDQLFSYCGERVTTRDVIEILGLVSQEAVADIGTGLLAGDLKRVLARLAQVVEQGLNIKRFCADLLAWFRHLLLFSLHEEPEQVLDLPEDELARLARAAASVSPETITAIFTLLVQGLEKVHYSSQPLLAVECALMQALQAREVRPMAELLDRFDRVLAGLPLPDQEVRRGGGEDRDTGTGLDRRRDEGGREHGTSARVGGNADTPPGPSLRKPEETSGVGQEVKCSGTAEPGPRTVSDPTSRDEGLPPPMSENSSPSPAEQDAAAVQSRSGKDVRKQWPGFIAYVHERKPWMAAALKLASSVTLEQEELVIRFDEAANCSLLKSRENVRLLTEFALDYFQENFTLAFKVPEGDGCAVDREGTGSARAERQALAREELVLAALDIFSGQVGDIRVGPRFRAPLAADTGNGTGAEGRRQESESAQQAE